METQYIKKTPLSTFHYKDKKMKILHREDGPAIEWCDGYEAWLIDGKFHREDGPAMVWPDGTEEWYIDGEKLTEEEFNKRTKE